MKSRYIIIAVTLFFLFAGCSGPEPELLIDSFEGDLNIETVDFGSSSDSSLKVEAEKELKAHGEQAIKLIYSLTPSGYMWAARGYNLDTKGAARWLVRPKKINWRRYNAISLFMYGSNSGGMVVFDVKDAGGEMWRFLLEDNFKGWKEIVCPFTQFFVRTDWQPQSAEKNDILDFPIMSFQFEPRLPGKGIYYFDCVKLVKIGCVK